MFASSDTEMTNYGVPTSLLSGVGAPCAGAESLPRRPWVQFWPRALLLHVIPTLPLPFTLYLSHQIKAKKEYI